MIRGNFRLIIAKSGMNSPTEVTLTSYVYSHRSFLRFGNRSHISLVIRFDGTSRLI